MRATNIKKNKVRLMRRDLRDQYDFGNFPLDFNDRLYSCALLET